MFCLFSKSLPPHRQQGNNTDIKLGFVVALKRKLSSNKGSWIKACVKQHESVAVAFDTTESKRVQSTTLNFIYSFFSLCFTHVRHEEFVIYFLYFRKHASTFAKSN